MCITDPGHKTKRRRDCLGCDQYGGKHPRRRGRRASPVVTITRIILTRLLIPALILGHRRCSADWYQSGRLCLIYPRTCPGRAYNNRLLSLTRPRHKITYITRSSRSWGSRISGFPTQRFHLQRCQTRNLIPTSRSFSETEIFFSLVGV